MSIQHTGTAKHVLPMGDPMDASIIQALRADLKEEQKRVDMLTVALERIRDCNWPGPNAEILSHWEMRHIAREALQTPS